MLLSGLDSSQESLYLYMRKSTMTTIVFKCVYIKPVHFCDNNDIATPSSNTYVHGSCMMRSTPMMDIIMIATYNYICRYIGTTKEDKIHLLRDLLNYTVHKMTYILASTQFCV